MIVIKNARDVDGNRRDIEIKSVDNQIIDASGLTILPAVIDPHVHFRTPGLEHKEDWKHAAQAAINGGCTMVFDMPNVLPPTITEELLVAKKALIDRQLQNAGIPLRYELYIGADKNHLTQLAAVKNQVIGIKVFMGCSTGNLVIDDEESLNKVFEIAAANDMLVAVHAEDEEMMHASKAKHFREGDYTCHSDIRNIDVAVRAVEKALKLCEKYQTRLYVLHVSSAAEVDLIRNAKQMGLPVYAETTPHHLFFDTSAYQKLHGKACVNPALRDASQRAALFAAIREGVIDTVGSDHAPHTKEEKSLPYGQCPSGMPGIEFMLPVLLNAHHQGLLSLDDIVNVTSRNARKIFRLPEYDDVVLVDLEKTAEVTQTASKCGWSPYMGMTFTGWPLYTILHHRLYAISSEVGAL